MQQKPKSVITKITDHISKLKRDEKKVLLKLLENMSNEGDGKLWFSNLKKFLAQEECFPDRVLGPFTIDATTGKRNFISAEGSVFNRLNDELWDKKIDDPGKPMDSVKIVLHPVNKEGKCPTLPGCPNADDAVCYFTQEQIVNFIEKNEDALWQNFGMSAVIFFNRDKKEDFHVFDIYFHSRKDKTVGVCVMDYIYKGPESLHRGENTYIAVLDI